MSDNDLHRNFLQKSKIDQYVKLFILGEVVDGREKEESATTSNVKDEGAEQPAGR